MGTSWYALVTKIGQEPKANQDLLDLDFRTFYPHCKVRRVHKTSKGPKVVWHDKAYFACYLFAQIPLNRMRKALSAYHVQNIVTFGDKPTTIPDPIMQLLMAGFDEKGLMGSRAEVEASRFRVLQQVRFVDDNPLRGVLARVLSDDGGSTIRVLLKVLGAERTVTVPATALEAA